MKKSVIIFSLVFVFLVLLLCGDDPVLAQGDTETETGSDAGEEAGDENFDVSLTELDPNFDPELVLPNFMNDWGIWKLVRLIEKGSINYEKTLTITNSGDADVTFDVEDIIVNIEGEESGEQLGKEFFSFEGLDDVTFEPNRELKITVKLDRQKLRDKNITPDKYSGYFKIWVNEMNDYLKIPVEISLKSPIWVPILVIFLAALAVPLGKAFVSSITQLETKVNYYDLFKRVEIKGKNTVGIGWFQTYLRKLYDQFRSGEMDKKTFEEKLVLVKKMLVLLDFEKNQKLDQFLKGLNPTDKEKKIDEITQEYKKLEAAQESNLETVIEGVKQFILDLKGVRDKGAREKAVRTPSKPVREINEAIRLRWAKAFFNLFSFVSWLFITAILIFWGLSAQYTNNALWGVNPISDWGAVFTWVFSSSLTTTSIKDLIQEHILSKVDKEGE